MSLYRIMAIASRIFTQFRRDRRTFAMIFIVPVLIMSLLAWIINSDEPPPKVGVMGEHELVDFFIDNAGANLDPDELMLVAIGAEEGEEDLRSGELKALIIFPENLEKFIVNKQTTEVILKIEGSQSGVSDRLGLRLPVMLDSFLKIFSQQNINFDRLNDIENQVAVIVQYEYGGSEFESIDYIAPTFISFFAFFFVYLLTSVSFLRERTQGTIERLYVSPIKKYEIILGYMAGFLFFALVQSTIIMLFVVYAIGINFNGELVNVFILDLALVLVSVGLGIFLSGYAKTELQVVQFIPLAITPQILLSGIFWPLDQLPPTLATIALMMPLTYANIGLNDIMIKGLGFTAIIPELLVLFGFFIGLFFLASISIRKGIG